MKNFSTVNGIESQRPPAGDIATPYECQVKRFKEMSSSISPGCRGFITSSHDFDSEEMISVAEDMVKKVIEFIEHIRG